MAILRRGSPYIPGYATPQNVVDEPFHRGAIVSAYRKRRTIDGGLRNPRQVSGYVIPQSVRDEPLGQGVRTTHYTKRGTIFGTVPEIATTGKESGRIGVGIFDDDQRSGKLGILSGSTIGGRSTLGALGDTPSPGSTSDGIAQFAQGAAATILADARHVAPEHRKIFVQAVLGNMDKRFPADVEAKSALLMKEKGYDAKTALQKAIAIVLANHTAKQLVEIGRTGRVPQSGLCGTCAPSGLGSVWGTVKSYTTKAAGVVLAPATGGASLALTAPKTADKVADAVKSTASKVGKTLCKVADTGILKIGAAAAGGALSGPQGAQAGAAGADATQQVCAAQNTGPLLPVPPEPGIPLMPILIGGGILAAILILK
jgi:hypothetical protein